MFEENIVLLLLATSIMMPIVASTNFPNTTYTSHDTDPFAILQKTSDVLETAKFTLYRKKTQLALNSLDRAVPLFESIQSSRSDLLDQFNRRPPGDISYDRFKQTADGLDSIQSGVENRMDRDRLDIERYASDYKDVERQFGTVHQTLGEALLPGGSRNRNQINETADSVTGTGVYSGAPISRPILRSGPIPLTGCGGIRNADNGSIIYKDGEPLSANEGCMWIILAERQNDSSTISLNLKSAQRGKYYETYLSVGFTEEVTYGNPNSFYWTRFGSSTPETIKVTGPVAYIHFVSTPPDGDDTDAGADTVGAIQSYNVGFHLEYAVEYRKSNVTIDIPYNYSNIFLTGLSGGQRYPERGLYENYARTSIIIKPTLPDSALYIKWWDFEETHDVLQVWTFGDDFRWNREEMLGGRQSGSSLKKYDFINPRNDPILLMFRSDRSQAFDGFEFYWNCTTVAI